jgi:hypothetical protein
MPLLPALVPPDLERRPSPIPTIATWLATGAEARLQCAISAVSAFSDGLAPEDALAGADAGRLLGYEHDRQLDPPGDRSDGALEESSG